MKDDVRTAERQGSRRFGKDHVITNQHAHTAEIGRLKNGKALTALFVEFVNGHVHLIVTANLMTIATQKKRGVVN